MVQTNYNQSDIHRSEEQKQSLDGYLPVFQISEFHEIEVDRQVDAVYLAVKKLDLSKSIVVKFLFWLRRLPPEMFTLAAFLDNGFILLEEKENEEIILGFLNSGQGLKKATPKEFSSSSGKDSIKGVWNFKLAPIGSKTMLSTETRVFCPTKRSLIRFSLYWFFISQFSGLIRKILLRMIKKQAEIL